jgi:response regulator RpfG family c-di-GMP phosphodiesterase
MVLSQFSECKTIALMTESALTKAKLLIVENLDVILLRLNLVLNNTPSLEEIGESGHGEEAVRTAISSEPDVVLTDIGLPGINGVGWYQMQSLIVHIDFLNCKPAKTEKMALISCDTTADIDSIWEPNAFF